MSQLRLEWEALHTGFTRIEGDFSIWAQNAFKSDILTDALSFHYLYRLPVHDMVSPDLLHHGKRSCDGGQGHFELLRDLCPSGPDVPVLQRGSHKLVHSRHAGLTLHDSWYLEFFTNNDPLDNGFPSLHFGLPVGFLITE